jgi:pyruvate dehydrogenase E2 component (dihydrolipoamide acetyltransferase)
MAATGTEEIVMPQMGADMQEGTLLRWIKQPGEHVSRGEAIAEIETDKANVELESFSEGVLERTLAKEGQVVPVGEVVAIIRTGEGGPALEEPPAPAAQTASASASAQSLELESSDVSSDKEAAARPAAPTPASPTANGVAQGERLRVSPVARNVAAQLGVDLTHVSGTGPDGRIVRWDVEAAAAASPAAAAVAAASETMRAPAAAVTAPSVEVPAAARPAAAPPAQPAPATAHVPAAAPAGAVQPLSRMRQAIARRMAQSKREQPHYYVTVEVDMTEAMAFREQLNAVAGDDARVSVNDLIVKASIEALRRYPVFNASFGEEGLHQHEAVNLCIAIAMPDGLVAPAILDAGGKSLGTIARDTKDLVNRARSGQLRPAEMGEGTFTISNLGMYGIETLIPIIQPGQAAILGIGSVQDKPAVRDGQIVARKLMSVALAADHRVSDGAQGAEFLREIQNLLEHPLRLAL